MQDTQVFTFLIYDLLIIAKGFDNKLSVSDLLNETKLACPGIEVDAANDLSIFELPPPNKKVNKSERGNINSKSENINK